MPRLTFWTGYAMILVNKTTIFKLFKLVKMKKVLIFVMSLALLVSVNTKAQTKSGILKKDAYGAFNGDDWEDILSGNRSEDFEKKSNVKLSDYLQNQVLPFVKDQLKEPSIASAVANSTVVSFPEGADVYTATANGTWIHRTAYPGEKGFFHTSTGLYWLSFSCGNLTAFGSTKNTTENTMTYNKPSNPQPVNGGGNTNTVTINPSSGQGQELSWSVGYAVYNQGRNDRQTDFLIDASLFKGIQESKQCCQSEGFSGQQTQMSSMPVQYVAAQPQAQQVVYTTGQGGNKVNPLDVINTVANVAQTTFYGINTFRGYRLEGSRYGNSGYYGGGGGYYNNGTGGPVQGGFNSGSTGGYYNNGGSTGGGGGPVQGTGFGW